MCITDCRPPPLFVLHPLLIQRHLRKQRFQPLPLFPLVFAYTTPRYVSLLYLTRHHATCPFFILSLLYHPVLRTAKAATLKTVNKEKDLEAIALAYLRCVEGTA